MPTQFENASNNARTKALIGSLNHTLNNTTFDVNPGEGVRFPTSNFLVTAFSDAYTSPGEDNLMEIMRVTTRSGDVFSGVLRGLEGTTIVAHSGTPHIAGFFTKGQYEKITASINAAESTLGGMAAGATVTEVGATNVVGVDTDYSREDHVHKGVHSITKNGGVPLYGDIVLVPGLNTSISQVGQEITIASSAPPGDTVAEIAATAVGGASADYSRKDHAHRGIHSIAKGGSVALYGDVVFSGLDGVSLTQTGQNIKIGFSGNSKSITQNAHGLSVLNPVRLNGANYVKAQANSLVNAEVVGIVSAVTDDNNFVIMMPVGLITGAVGWTAGQNYYLSPTTAGELTTTEPSVIGQVSKLLVIADGTTSGYFLNQKSKLVEASAAPQYPRLFQTIPILGYTVVEGAWSINRTAESFFGVEIICNRTPPQSIKWEVLLDSGTYRFECFTNRSPYSGNTSIYIDNVNVGTFSTNSGGFSEGDIYRSVPGIVIATAGLHTIKIRYETGDWSLGISFLSMVRTGA